MNSKVIYAIVGIIAAAGLITATSMAANSAYAGFGSKQECIKFFQNQYKQGSISKEQLKSDKESCRSNF